MRVRDIDYALNPEMSPGLSALRRQLGDAGEGAPPDVLGPVSALQELAAICAGMLSGRGGPNPANRSSLAADLGLALRCLGDEVRTALGTRVTDFQAELPRIKARLDNPQGARVIALALRPLMERLGDEDVLRAAWRDTVGTFTDVGSSAEECERRLLQLAELAEHRGVDYRGRALTLEYILSDDARVLADSWEGTRASTGTDPTYAGVPEERRLERCEQALPEKPSSSSIAVWLVIENAALERGYLKLGPVQLFSAELWPDGARHGGALERSIEGFTAPPELGDYDQAAMWFEGLPEAEHRLFARVWVEDSTLPRARKHAREVVASMIDVAKSDSAWRLLEGAVSWREGGGWSGSTFQDPAMIDAGRGPAHLVFERTARNLQDFDEAFIARWLAGDAVVMEAVDDALWTVSVERAPAAPQRIVLAIRALERTLSRAREQRDDNWAPVAGRFLRAPWVRYTLEHELLDAGVAAVYRMPGRHHANAELNRKVHASTFPPTGPGERTFSVRGLAEVAEEALATMAEGSMEQRIVRDATAVLKSAEAMHHRLGELGTRFDRLLSRTERQRNALVHGTGVANSVLATVDDFVVVLARYVAQEAMRQAETGKEPLIEFEHARAAALDADARLAAGEHPLDVLFPET